MQAQQKATEWQLAEQYLQNAQYDKAVDLYERLYDKQPEFFYQQYMQCLIATKNYDRADKIARKQYKRTGGAVYLVDGGYLLKLQGATDKANSLFDKALKELKPDPNLVIQLAEAFKSKQEDGYAIETYLKGRKLLGTNSNFGFELAELYTRKQDLVHMMDEYLEIAAQNEGYIQQVQNILQTNLADDPESKKNEYVKGLLLKRIQNDPQKQVYSDLLIWLFIQQKEFDAAFVQVRAMDKRLKEDGSRVYSLGQVALSNQAYEAAEKCFQYVLDRGKSNLLYVSARMSMLEAGDKKLTSNLNYTKAQVLALEKEYKAAQTELGETAETAQLNRGLAHLQAFYLDKLGDAVSTLERTIELPGISKRFRAECKLELGDILMIQGTIWEAVLLYGQVDTDFKLEPMGEEAKLRNARLSYYNGEFEWAQAQLDVLKSGTSHLIANDAMALSLLISDNMVDSNTVPLSMYARADLYEYQHKYSEALSVLDSVNQQFPKHPLNDEVLYKKAGIMRKQGKTEAAVELLQAILTNYPDDILADDALFDMADIYEHKLLNLPKAMELYQQLMTKYTASLYVTEARKRFRLLRGDVVN